MRSRSLLVLSLQLSLAGFTQAQAPAKSATTKLGAAAAGTPGSSCAQGSIAVPSAFISALSAVVPGQVAAPAPTASASANTCIAIADAQSLMQAATTLLVAMHPSAGGLAGQALATGAASSAVSTAAAAANLAGGAGSNAGGDAVKSAAANAIESKMAGGSMIGSAMAAGGFAKGLAGRFSRGESKESMTKGLLGGRLVVKGIRFIAGSDALADGADQSIATLAGAMQGITGTFTLRLPVESDDKTPADTSLARRRLARVAGYLQLAGIPDGRVTIGDAAASDKPAKPGDARVEVLRSDTKP